MARPRMGGGPGGRQEDSKGVNTRRKGRQQGMVGKRQMRVGAEGDGGRGQEGPEGRPSRKEKR